MPKNVKTSKISQPDASKAIQATTAVRAPVKRSSKTDDAPETPARGFGASFVYDSLRDDILSLRMQPGALLDETELAERFKVSRSPIREALIRLSGEGLVQTLRNRSSIVAPFDVSMVPSHVNATVLMYCTTARLAAINRTPIQLQALQEMFIEHSADTKRATLAVLVSNNRAFHLAIAEAAGNPYFKNWMTGVLDQGQRLLGMYLNDSSGQRSEAQLDYHAAIVNAIAKGDPEGAEQAARADAMILFDQLSRHLFKDALTDQPLGALLSVPKGR